MALTFKCDVKDCDEVAQTQFHVIKATLPGKTETGRYTIDLCRVHAQELQAAITKTQVK